MFAWINQLFESDFMPHGHCYFWSPDIVWSHAISDGIIALAYLIIPISLTNIVYRRRDFRYIWIAILFSIFILGCGTTHVFDVITIWKPYYRMDVLVRIITALASVGTAFVLVKYSPQIILIPTAESFQKINQELVERIKELEKSKLFIQKIADTSPDIIYVYDLEERKGIYSNRRLGAGIDEKVDGNPNEGDTFIDQLITLGREDDLFQYFTEVENANDNPIKTIEYPIKDLSGNERWFLLRQTPFQRNTEGKVSQIIGVATDITERKKYLQKIEKSEALLLESQEIAKIGSYEWDLKNKQILWTPTLYKIYGLPQNTSISYQDFEERVHPEDKVQVNTAVQRTIESGVPFNTEFRIVLPDQSIKHIYGQGKVFLDDKGEPDKMIGTNLDITERVQTEKELQNIKEFVFLSEAMPQLVWTCQPNGEFDYVNHRWTEYTGVSYEESQTDVWKKVIYPEDYDQAMALWKDALSHAKEFEMELCLKRNDGIYRWFLARSIPMKDNKGNLLKMFGTCTYIHHIKEQSEELAVKNEQLIKINNDLDNFVYTASHDLKAPISNLEGLLDTIFEETNINCTDEVSGLFQMMGTSIQKLKTTISELTEISQIQKNIEQDVQKVNINELIEEFKVNCGKQIEESHAEVLKELDEQEIEFSKRNARSIIYNLLSNAIKYRSPEREPKVSVKSYKEDLYTVLEVSDNGLGLDIRQKEKIFTMFKRLHSHVEGTGVGLYIVKRILDNTGGKIDVFSEIGKGSTFKVYFKSEEV